MTYEAWRCTYQSAEAAAHAAYGTVEQQAARITALEQELTDCNAELAAIGAGGVEPLRKCSKLHQIAEPVASAEKQIDEAYAHKLALELECMLIDPTAYWDSAAKLLDEYKAAWNEINPSPPPFGSDFPVPPERKAIFAAMKARRAAIAPSQPNGEAA